MYRKLLWNEEDDEYMGFEEQGITYEEWKHGKMNKINVHTLNDSQEIESDPLPVILVPHN
ncbi:hypothetical protein KQH65_07370 [archaeon]|nr:hypothetical protein [archaeon]